MKGPTAMLCPCGGNAWSLVELEALCSTEEEKEMYRSILASPGALYCSDEDDVLLLDEGWPRS